MNDFCLGEAICVPVDGPRPMYILTGLSGLRGLKNQTDGVVKEK